MNTTFTALVYLHAWENHLPISRGVAFEDRLRTYSLDYSVQSLARIDAFLDELRDGKKIQQESYLKEPTAQTLFYLLAFYVGEVIGRSLRSEPEWLSYEAYQAQAAGDPSEKCFETSLILHFPGNSRVKVQHFKPLISITERAFSASVSKSVLFSAGLQIPVELQSGPSSEAPLPPLPPRAWPVDVAGWINNAAMDEVGRLAIPVPEWAASDDLRFLFDHAQDLLRGGRVVWGALIQANNSLFDPAQLLDGGGAPGEVIYDPRGRAPPEALAEIAKTVLSFKGKSFDDAGRAHIAAYLANEHMRVFGLDFPQGVLPYPLKLSTTWFERAHFPLGALMLGHFPLLISDAFPGAVLPLPCRLWPADFTGQWLAAGKARNLAAGRDAYMPPAELAYRHPMSLVEEGHAFFQETGIAGNFEKARQAWQRAADAGNQGGFRGLARLYEGGHGVAQDAQRAIEYYELAVKHGCTSSQAAANALRARLGGGVAAVAKNELPSSAADLFQLGCQYYEADGAKRDVAKAMQLWERAARRGHAPSLFNLGVIYQNGDDVERNMRVAMGYYQRAADKGSAEAREFLSERKRTLIGIFEWLFRKG